jgi:ATP synthase protein I
MTPALINWQMKASFVLTVFVVILFGLDAGISVLIGLMSVVSGMIIGSRIAHRTAKSKEPFGIVINMLKAEAVKIIVVITVLWIAFKFYKALVPLALIVGLAVAAILSGASIVKLNKIDK